MYDLAIILPVIGDHGGPRDRAAVWCTARWTNLLADMHWSEGMDGYLAFAQPNDDATTINLSALCNSAAEQTPARAYYFIGADMFVNVPTWFSIIGQLVAGVAVAYPDGPQIRLTDAETATMYRGRPTADCPVPVVETPYSRDNGILITREALETINYGDERFINYGCGEHAFLAAIRTLVGEPARYAGAIYHLYHPDGANWPTPPGSEVFNQQHLQRYYAAMGHPDAMRALVAGNRQA